MPGLPREQEAVIRRFKGVNVTVDPGFLPPDTLQRSSNFVPDLTYLLTKRVGSTLFASFQADATSIAAIFRAYDIDLNRQLYAVAVGGLADQIYVSLNDAATPIPVTGGAFASESSDYGIAQLGNRVYFGNGVDPLKVIDLGVDPALATDIVPLATTSVTGAAVVPAPDNTSRLENGTYTYAWAVYNTVTKKYVSRSPASGEALGPPDAVLDGVRSRLSFTSPSTALGANEVYQLFVAPRNFPIEFAFLQVDTLAASTTFDMSDVRDSGVLVPSIAQTVRTGRFLVAHRGRLYIAGDRANPSRVYATGTIVPGLEQALFDIGDYYPANANLPIELNDGDEITNMAVASQRQTINDPRAPLCFFKTTSMHALFGDLFDDDAQLDVISQSIGQIGRTAVSTPVGVIHVALDSVYVFRADAGVPINIGQPIASAIRAIDPSRRPFAHAIFHDGFYKLFITPPGGGENTTQWWLDLRQGLTDPPAWWGPHPGGPITAACVGHREPVVREQAFGAYELSSGGAIWNVSHWDVDSWATTFMAIDTLNTGGYRTECGAAINESRIRTVIVDNDTPFQRHIYTRFRALGRTELDISAHLKVFQDGALDPAFEGDLQFEGTGGAQWNIAQWNIDSWASPSRFTEGDLVLGGAAARPHTIYTEFEFKHVAPIRFDLRDCAVRILPVTRPVK